MFTKNDITYLAARTKLSSAQLLSLVEEQEDFYLLLSEITKKPILSTKKLSKSLLLPLLVFHYSQSFECNIRERGYVSRAIIEFDPKPRDSEGYKNKDLNEELARKGVGALFWFPDRFTQQNLLFLRSFYEKNLYDLRLHFHIIDWIKIFTEIKKDKLFGKMA